MSDPGFTTLTGEENIEYQQKPRETSAMWRAIVGGQRVFIADYKPNQLGYWYRKARAQHMQVEMKQATVDGKVGTIIERVYTTEGLQNPSQLGG